MASDSTSDSELEVDVVIVGAGLSGIRAAVELHKAGLTIAIFERNDHVGGQCHSTCPSRVTTIGDIHTEMLSLATDFKLDLIKQQPKEGLSLQQRYDWIKDGPRVTETIPALENVAWTPDGFRLSCRPSSFIEYSAVQWFYSRISELSETWHGPDALLLDAISFLGLVGANSILGKAVEQEAHFLTNFLLGVHPAHVSALYVLDHIASGGELGNLYFHPDSPGGGAHHLRVRQGSQAFVTNLVDLLPEGCIHLSTVVNKITQIDRGSKSDGLSHPCKIDTSPSSTTNIKTFHARKVLVTTPPSFYSLLYSRNPSFIAFHPPLPAPKLASVNRHSQHHTYFTAITFFFSQPWWREAGLSGSMDCRVTRDVDEGVISWMRDTSEDDMNAGKGKKWWSLTCFSAAEKGEEVWDWMCNTYLTENDDFPEMMMRPEDWEGMPVWRHLRRVFGERMDVLRKMEILLPREHSQEEEKERDKEKQENGALPLPVSFEARRWYGMGIPLPREMPKDKKEVEELLKTWKYEGPGKGDAVIREPFGHVHFAGAEIAEEWRGSMEGAARSGVRGTKEVIEALKKEDKEKKGVKAHL